MYFVSFGLSEGYVSGDVAYCRVFLVAYLIGMWAWGEYWGITGFLCYNLLKTFSRYPGIDISTYSAGLFQSSVKL